MDTAEFLRVVVTTREGWFNLATRNPSEEWRNEWYSWPEDAEQIVARGLSVAHDVNVYFSAHLFERRDASKRYVLPGRTIQCDLDEAPLYGVTVRPNVLVETSPGRHQAYWVLPTEVLPDELERLSRNMTYSVEKADRSGWSLGHKMRLPGTLNHKYAGKPKPVFVVNANLVLTRLRVPEPDPLDLPLATPELDLDWKPTPLDIDAGVRWDEVKGRLPRDVVSAYTIRAQDRSNALWRLELALFRAGLSRDEVFWICRYSANNKFADNRYHGDWDLGKDVRRAEIYHQHHAEHADERDVLAGIRGQKMSAMDKRQKVAEQVRDFMLAGGTLVRTDTGQSWYVRSDTGRPLEITRDSEWLHSFLTTRYGLNATEVETRFVVAFLGAWTREHGRAATLGVLSHYDSESGAVMLHGGRRDVWRIDAHNVHTLVNGDLDYIFPWRMADEPFTPAFGNEADTSALFDGAFDNLIEATPNQALSLVRAWLMFLLLRSDAVARPILALLGQPGSGKSTLFRRVYVLLYGARRALNTITKPDDFDHAVSTDPFVVFDNLDVSPVWLPDKLATSAAPSALSKRKLYTDNDSFIVKRDALIGITAHDPKFRREDIVDRLVMLNFKRLDVFRPESEIIARVDGERDRIWAGLVADLQTVLRCPKPSEAEVPKFRVNDFARIGLWVSRALGFEDDFRTALALNLAEQTLFNLEEEDVLIDTIERWLKVNATNDKQELWYSANEIFALLCLYARDEQVFTRHYRDSVRIGRKLWTLGATLGTLFDVNVQYDEATGRRLWRIKTKKTESVNGA